MADVYAVLKSFGLVGCVLLFAGIVAWAFWPGRKARLEAHGRIPLEDDDRER